MALGWLFPVVMFLAIVRIIRPPFENNKMKVLAKNVVHWPGIKT